MKPKFILLVLLTSLGMGAFAQNTTKLASISRKVVHVKEPSDICISPDKQHFYIVSDNGMLVKTNLDFVPVQQADRELYDPEAVYCDQDYIYVVEERTRTLIIFDQESLKTVRSMTYPYNGGRNKGYEAFTLNKALNRYVLITEKDPIWIFELDMELKVYNQFEFHYRGDISSATWHVDKLWLLSDENMEILRLNPRTYEIEHIYKVPVINPEGFVFMPDGSLIVVSDDMQVAFTFRLDTDAQ